MPHEFITSYIKDSSDLFRYYKNLADRAMAQCPDAALFTTLDAESNSIAIIVKRSEEHTSELQSHLNLVCRLLLEKKKRRFSRPPRSEMPLPTQKRNRS